MFDIFYLSVSCLILLLLLNTFIDHTRQPCLYCDDMCISLSDVLCALYYIRQMWLFHLYTVTRNK